MATVGAALMIKLVMNPIMVIGRGGRGFGCGRIELSDQIIVDGGGLDAVFGPGFFQFAVTAAMRAASFGAGGSEGRLGAGGGWFGLRDGRMIGGCRHRRCRGQGCF